MQPFLRAHAMNCPIANLDDLRWLMAHTGGFRSGYVTDVQMSKRRLFDETSGRDVLAGTTVLPEALADVAAKLRAALAK